MAHAQGGYGVHMEALVPLRQIYLLNHARLRNVYIRDVRAELESQ